jgi:hypothetical protein
VSRCASAQTHSASRGASPAKATSRTASQRPSKRDARPPSARPASDWDAITGGRQVQSTATAAVSLSPSVVAIDDSDDEDTQQPAATPGAAATGLAQPIMTHVQGDVAHEDMARGDSN